jgi:hypothetical protein
LFSVDPSTGEEKTYINLKSNGDIELNGNSDNAVRYSELKTAMDELKDDFNTFVAKYTTHTHLDSIGGTTGTTSAPATNTSFDISGSKIDTIKTP